MITINVIFHFSQPNFYTVFFKVVVIEKYFCYGAANMKNNASCSLNKPCCCYCLRWIGLALLIAIIDQIIKNIVIDYMSATHLITVTSFFNVVLSFNRGAAFGWLNHASSWSNWLFGIISALISIVIILSLCRLPKKQPWLSTSLALILGGALGNLWDRLLRGYVVDFLDFHINSCHWPAFNLADSAIVIGVLMFFLVETKLTST
jgi:signal peptidase II